MESGLQAYLNPGWENNGHRHGTIGVYDFSVKFATYNYDKRITGTLITYLCVYDDFERFNLNPNWNKIHFKNGEWLIGGPDSFIVKKIVEACSEIYLSILE